eukprot:m51a1_g4159 hypothetical protein (93) ;mRNA; r:264792-265070
MTQVFCLVSKPYIFDTDNLVTDINNIIVLMNKHISELFINENDSIFYCWWMDAWWNAREERQCKKLIATAAYCRQKRSLIEHESQDSQEMMD